METKILLNDHCAFLCQYNHLLQNKLMTEALGLAVERLRQLLQSDAHTAQARVTLLKAIKLADESSVLCSDLKAKLSELGQMLNFVSDSQMTIDRQEVADRTDNGSTDRVVSTLSAWLDNIHRIKEQAGHIE
jgi:hypothetical protein